MSPQLLGLPQVFLLYSGHEVTELVHLIYHCQNHQDVTDAHHHDPTHRQLEVLDDLMERRSEGVVVSVGEYIVNTTVLKQILLGGEMGGVRETDRDSST